jgi:hypothetical protein
LPRSVAPKASGNDDDSSSSSGSASGSSSDSSSSDSDSSAGSIKKRVLGKKKRVEAKAKRRVRPKRALKRKRFGNDAEGAGAGAGAGAARAKSGVESDEYDSDKDVTATAADNAFIDADSDDAALLAEYGRDRQDFEDEAPRRSKKGKRDTGEDISGEKRTKAGKRVEMPDEEKRALVRSVLKTMREAARADIADKKAEKPAVSKLKALPAVREAVANTGLHEFLLEGTVLGLGGGAKDDGAHTILVALRDWLRPLPGSDLPNMQLREAAYEMLAALPISLDHLRESRLGPILVALSEHPKESPAARMKLKALIDKFSRQIFNKRSSYKGAMVHVMATQEHLGLVSGPAKPSGVVAARAQVEADALGAGGDAAMEALLGDEGASLPTAVAGLASPPGSAAPVLAKDMPRHARIPAPLMFDYTRRPASAVVEAAVKAALGAGASNLAKKMVEDKRKRKQGMTKGVKMSIEGRGVM